METRPELEIVPVPKCILVVDDDAVIRLVVSELLRDVGLKVIEASCSADAMAYLRAGGAVDLIFSDIQMAGPLDGLLLARHVRANHPAIPLILTSGSAKPAGLDGAYIFVRKPYTLDGIVAMITKTLTSTDDSIR